jgi:hypothetical protein
MPVISALKSRKTKGYIVRRCLRKGKQTKKEILKVEERSRLKPGENLHHLGLRVLT